MAGRARLLAAVLLVLVGAVVLRRAGWLELPGAAGAGTGAEATGPAVPGARGKLAFVRSGDLWIYDLRVGAERRLTQRGGVTSPLWSGSGSWLSFEREGRLWVMRQDGTGEVGVPGGDRPASARWSPRAARLAFASSDGSLSTFDPASATRRTLLPPGSGAGPGLSWSPDGGRLAYERHQRAAPQVSNEGIWTIGATGADPLPVYVSSGSTALSLCCWTRTGRYLLFWTGTVPVEEAGPTRGAGADPNAAPPIVRTPAPAPAAGTRPTLPLYLVRASSAQPVPTGELTLPWRAIVDGAPGADDVAFVAGEPFARPSRLVVAAPQVDRSGRTTIAILPVPVPELQVVGAVVWAPTGKQLAFVAGPLRDTGVADASMAVARRRIWLAGFATPGGEAPHPLLADATVPAGVSDEHPLWARDGRSLLFVRRLAPEQAWFDPQAAGPGAEVWVATVDGTAAHRIAGGLADAGSGAFGVVDWTAQVAYFRG